MTRVAIVGAESTGKTTLAIALAEHYQTTWVPEFGRLYTEARRPRGELWSSDEFTFIAVEQARMEDALARIAAKNHKNGVANPLAQMQKDLGYEFCRTVSDKNPIVAGPLKRTDCSLVSDGAAAVVLADTATALSLKRADLVKCHRAAQPGERDAMDGEPVQRGAIAAGVGLEKGGQLIHQLALGHLVRTTGGRPRGNPRRRRHCLARPGSRS